jgi:hypothetical protein
MIADLIVVDGDPTRDIRVLQDKQNIVGVIKDGRIVDFSDEDRLVLRPYEPAQIFQTDLLMFDTVYGDPEHRSDGFEPLPWSPDEGRELAGDLKRREVAQRGTATHAMGLRE